MLAFFSYQWSLENSSENFKLDKYFGMTIFFAFLSMLSKEQGLTVLAVCIVYDILANFKHGISDIRNALNRILSDWRNNNNLEKWDSNVLKTEVLPVAIRILLMSLSILSLMTFRLWVVDFQPPNFTYPDNPASFHPSFILRTVNYNYLYVLNLWLLVNPSELCFDYSMGCVPLIQRFSDPRIILVLLFWTISSVIIYSAISGRISSQKNRFLQFSVCCLIVPFLPASNLVFRVGFVLAERVLYLPSIGYCMIIGAVLESAENCRELSWRICCKKLSCGEKVLEVALLGTVLLFSAKSLQRSKEWCSESALFQSGAAVCPNNAKVHYNLGKILSDLGHIKDAETKYREALRLHPSYEHAMNNLANVLKDQQNFQEAESLLLRAVNIRPDFAAAWMNLGIVQAAIKKYSEAENSYLTALTYRTHYPDCYFNLGNLYLDQGRGYEALACWVNATQQKPSHLRAWINQLIFLDAQNECNRAVSVGMEGLRYLPGEPALHFSLASCLGKLSKVDMAEKHFLMAIQLDGENANYFANLGILYHRAERFEKAELMYLKALRMDPGLKQIEKHLQSLRRKREKIQRKFS